MNRSLDTVFDTVRPVTTGSRGTALDQVRDQFAAYLVAVQRVARACHEKGWV